MFPHYLLLIAALENNRKLLDGSSTCAKFKMTPRGTQQFEAYIARPSFGQSGGEKGRRARRSEQEESQGPENS